MKEGPALAISNPERPPMGNAAAAPSLAEYARTLVAGTTDASLASHAVSPAGYPYVSAVSATLHGAEPVLLLSGLAEHTKNLRADSRCSLLFSERRSGGDSAGAALALGRVTLLGGARALPAGDERERVREIYLSAVPEASAWCDFADFGFYLVEIQSVRMIRGFGRMSWIDADEWRCAEPDPMAAFASGILEHMNADHADALRDYVRAFAGAPEAESVEMLGIDRYGFEVVDTGGEGNQPIRFGFASEVSDSAGARRELVRLVGVARKLLAAS